MQHKKTMNPMPARLRAAAARTPRGSSSLLRLSSALSRLPSSAALGHWIDRAARASAALA